VGDEGWQTEPSKQRVETKKRTSPQWEASFFVKRGNVRCRYAKTAIPGRGPLQVAIKQHVWARGHEARREPPNYFRLRFLPRLRWRRRRDFLARSRFSSEGFMYAMFCRYSRSTRLRFTWRRKRLSARSIDSFPRTLTPTAKINPLWKRYCSSDGFARVDSCDDRRRSGFADRL